MTELKRCPFCGSSALVIYKSNNEYVSCETCHARKWLSEWNTRPIEDELNSRIKELEEQLCTCSLELRKEQGFQ
jgi:hypothetical protein